MKIHVTAKPNAREEKVEKISETEFVVFVKEPPTQGLANRAIVLALANYFGVSQSRVRISSGHTSRRKVVELS